MSPRRGKPAKPARRAYSEKQKAAVIAALLEGQSLNQVSKAYRIPIGTVKAWRSRLQPDVPVATPKESEAIGQLLLDYLRSSLGALRAQTEVFKDPEWLKKQDASELAVLHGVMTDKAVRLLEAMEPVGDARPLGNG